MELMKENTDSEGNLKDFQTPDYLLMDTS